MMNVSDFSENLQRCHDYIKALEVERRKIQVFGRELPLSLELVTQAIETCKQQLSSGTITSEHNLHGQLSEYSDHTSPNVPFFEEFIPMKKASSDHSDDEEHESKNETGVCDKDWNKINDIYCKKSDWLRSVQLWNQTPDPDPKDSAIKEEKSMGCHVTATPPTPVNEAAPPLPTSSPAESGDEKKKDEKESRRKSRRCWSPELHRRFVQALQQLGGAHVATPKQIRELMKVDGLSNDEVKSHLQKYRLHTRPPSSPTNNTNTQTPQFVVVGGIWVPPEYAAMAKTTTSTEGTSVAATSNKIYAPIAAPPPSPSPKQRLHIKPSSLSDERDNHSIGATQSCSPATSSSTHTTTISPAC